MRDILDRSRQAAAACLAMTWACAAGSDAPRVGEPAWAPGEGWQISAEPELTIGTSDGPAAYTFSGVTDATLLSDGTLVVVDARNAEIRFFGPDGNYLRTSGGRGKGPGEFQGPWTIVRTDSDTIVVADMLLRRVTVFDPQGRHVRDLTPTVAGELYAAGAVTESAILLHVTGVRQPVDGLTQDSIDVGILDLESGTFSSLGLYPDMERIGTVSERGMSSRIAPFARSTYLAAGGGRYFIGLSERDEIRAYDEDGNVQSVIGGVRETPATTPGLVRKYYDAMRPNGDVDEYLRRGGHADAAPPTWPAYDNLLADSEGNLWVRRYLPPWTDENAEWDVHESSGRWLGTVRMPVRRTRLGPLWPDMLEVGHDYALFVLQDELGVQRVAKFRLIKGSD